MSNRPDWCPADVWEDTGMKFGQLYDAEPDLEGGCEHGVREMAARMVMAERERCSAHATAELRNTSLLLSNPPQSSAAWDIRNAINAGTPAP